jgi:hypothetical protein
MAEYVIAIADGLLWPAPERTGTPVGSLPHDTLARLLDRKGDWILVETEHEQQGWVEHTVIRLLDDPSVAVPVHHASRTPRGWAKPGMSEEQPRFDPNAEALGEGQTTVGEPIQWLREPDSSFTYDSYLDGGRKVEILDLSGAFVLARAGTLAGWLPLHRVNLPVIVRMYKGQIRTMRLESSSLMPLQWRDAAITRRPRVGRRAPTAVETF